MVCCSTVLLALSWLSVLVPVGSYDVPSLVCVDPKYLNTSSNTFAFIYILVSGLSLMLLTRILLLLGADFHAVISSCFLQSFNELLQYCFTASQKVDIVRKLQVAKWSTSDGH